jgi:S1-C subfamily serine protease
MKAGDLITALNKTPVWTFADFQYHYDKVPRTAKQVHITVERDGKPVDLTVALPLRWWFTDIRNRQLSIDPRMYFESKPLTDAEKKKYELPLDGFASEVTYVDAFAEMLKSHELRVGDIITAVDGVQRDEYANTAEFYIRLRKTAGDPVMVDLIRDGRRMQMPVKTFRMNFRK